MYFIAGYGRFQEVPVKSDFSAGSAPDDEVHRQVKSLKLRDFIHISTNVLSILMEYTTINLVT